MKHLKTPQELNEASENLNISDVSCALNFFEKELKRIQDIIDDTRDVEEMTEYRKRKEVIEKSISYIHNYKWEGGK
jgi:hypothetical protein